MRQADVHPPAANDFQAISSNRLEIRRIMAAAGMYDVHSIVAYVNRAASEIELQTLPQAMVPTLLLPSTEGLIQAITQDA